MSPKPRASATLDQVTEGKKSDPKPPAAAPEPTPPAETTATRTPPPLPTEPTSSSGELEHKMVTIYGPPGIGKSTLASQWAGGSVFFFNCAGELGDLHVLQQPITSWPNFREYAWAVSEAAKKGDIHFGVSVIDTADVLGRYCSEKIRREYGIRHESELDYGIGWSALRDEFSTNIAKLAAIPNHGVIFVAHADEKKVKTRSSEYDKWQIRGVKGIRESMLDMSDLVLFVDYGEADDERVIKTKPSRYWDAKERGVKPRLDAEIPWHLGDNGWDVIEAAWKAGA